MKSVFSVDVEDWFHILDLPSTPPLQEWDGLPSRVERNFLRLLDLFSEKQVHVTCFFLGWVARRYSRLLREADRRGHEVASHGYAHRLVYELTPQQFLEDAVKSKKIIEDIVGRKVLGFRSAGFSVNGKTPWFYEKLRDAGYVYDSSVFPAARSHGGFEEYLCAPFRVDNDPHGLIEFPITVANVLGKPLCFFGGGYLRLFPYPIIRKMGQKVLASGRPIIFYVHPREIDPCHPRLPMNLFRKFRSYVNLKTTEIKIRQILADFEITSFRDYLAQGPAPPALKPISNAKNGIGANTPPLTTPECSEKSEVAAIDSGFASGGYRGHARPARPKEHGQNET